MNPTKSIKLSINPTEIRSLFSKRPDVMYFEKFVGKTYTWYVPKIKNSADYIHCSSKQDTNGYGGSEIKFHLLDGSIDAVKGPYHSNSNGLFNDTGVDVRKKCETYVVLGLDLVYGDIRGYEREFSITNVFHCDEKPVIGSFNRDKKLIQEYQGRHKVDVAFYMQSTGGSCDGKHKYGAKW